MSRIIAVAFAWLLPLAANAADKPLHLTQQWQVSIDAAGKVAALKDPGGLQAALREPLERAIRGWTFEPGQLGGEPAPTDTTLTLDLSFVAAADGNYSVRIDDARLGGTIDRSRKAPPPRFPRDAMKPGLVAMVVVKADYAADGRIVAVEPQPAESLNATRSLQAATVAAVKRWAVTPERVGGQGVASSVMVPICYTVTSGRHAPPDYACTWTPQGSRSRVGDGTAFAVAPAAKLATDVIGRTL